VTKAGLICGPYAAVEMFETRRLPAIDIYLIGEIDRSEHVSGEYVVVGEQLTKNPVDWEIPTFDPVGTGEHSVHDQVEHWKSIVDRGGVLIGAFEGDQFLGLAIIDTSFEPGLAWLAFLHVSKPFRRRGVATALWNEATRLAADAGSDSMYVSAIRSSSAVDFYLSHGCTLAQTPHPVLFEEEPEDIHLICPIAENSIRP